MQQGETWFGQYKQIDTPTFIYEELDPMVDDPYGRTPILPVLQVVFFHLQVLQDLKAVVHNQGYPRMDVSMLEEVMLKNIPAQIKQNPNEQRKWLTERMEEMQKHFNSLNPDDALFHWDSVKVGVILMQYIHTVEVKIDLTRALPEMQELILMVSMSQPNQHEFFKARDLWIGESLPKIEEQIKAV